MLIFIKVLGDDPDYEGMQKHQFIAIGSVYKIIPMHGVSGEEGDYWRSRPDTAGAQIFSYKIFDTLGHSYSCGNPEELKKLVYQALSNDPHGQSYFSSDQGGKTGVMPQHNEDFFNAEQEEKNKRMGVRI